MLETSARLLRLLAQLQARRDWPGPDLAARLGVSPRTLRRDIDRLRRLGYPADAVPGTAGGYRMGVGAVLPRCCSMTPKPSRSRSACAPQRAGLSP